MWTGLAKNRTYFGVHGVALGLIARLSFLHYNFPETDRFIQIHDLCRVIDLLLPLPYGSLRLEMLQFRNESE